MLAKKTVKNQITLPKKIADQFPGIDYFEVRKQGDSIVLEPVLPGRSREVRERLESLGLAESDIAAAVKWAREKGS
ncbi:MAG: AbrB/MazE/SpoVT family DNA-binding domain-containing protein [Thermoanaerobaculia bacterium]